MTWRHLGSSGGTGERRTESWKKGWCPVTFSFSWLSCLASGKAKINGTEDSSTWDENPVFGLKNQRTEVSVTLVTGKWGENSRKEKSQIPMCTCPGLWLTLGPCTWQACKAALLETEELKWCFCSRWRVCSLSPTKFIVCCSKTPQFFGEIKHNPESVERQCPGYNPKSETQKESEKCDPVLKKKIIGRNQSQDEPDVGLGR